jgi:BAHD acyltransferase
VLAASISHAIVDGFSYFHFLSSWARICRGERFLPPSLDRSFLEQLRPPGESDDLLASCGLFTGETRTDGPGQARRARRFTLSAEEVRAIVDDARRSTGVPLTENDILVAFLWKRSVSVKDGGAGYVTCPVDFRRLLPGFPRTYFGCALAFATASSTAEELENASVGRLAVLVRDAVGSIKAEKIRISLLALDRYRAGHGAEGMEKIHLRHPDRGLIVTNLTRMPIHDVDFGSGPPSDYVPYVDITGGAAIVPSGGGVTIISMDGPSSSQFGPFQ